MINKTKIICTIGPACNNVDIICDMISAGMKCARLNFSHGDYQFHRIAVGNIRKAAKITGIDIPIMQDLQGPKIRTGKIINNAAELKEKDEIKITRKQVTGNKNIISTNYPEIIDDVENGDIILIDDGKIRFTVIDKKTDSLICKIDKGGKISSHKGINLPKTDIKLPSLTSKDYSDIDFGLANNIDIISLSFVRKPADILKLKNILRNKGSNIPIIAKIERPEAVKNFNSIVKSADGIMVARGDMGVELSPEEVPVIQKRIISISNSALKPVITATQMLESMINNPIPTRAEASDVANAILDGTDCVMLSAETSIGNDPVGTVHMMSKIILKTEKIIEPRFKRIANSNSIISDLCFHASEISQRADASAIITFSKKGMSPAYLSNFRTKARIFSISENKNIYNRDTLLWGVIPIKNDEADSIKEKTEFIRYLAQKNYIKRNEKIVMLYNSKNHPNSSADTISVFKV